MKDTRGRRIFPKCVKCGWEFSSITYVKYTEYSDYDPWGCGKSGKEHFHVECSRCSYKWWEFV